MAGRYEQVLNPAVRVFAVLAIAAACSLLIGALLGARQVAHVFQHLRYG